MRPIDADSLGEYLAQLNEAYNEAHDMLEDGEPQKSVMYGKFTTVIETLLYVKRQVPTLDLAPKWISVEDRLPDTRHTMLVCTRNRNNVPKIAMAYFENGFGWCGSGGRWNNVTHWMPLPEPPKEE